MAICERRLLIICGRREASWLLPNKFLSSEALKTRSTWFRACWCGAARQLYLNSPGYAGAVCLFETFGAKLHPIPVDEKGIDVGQLPNTAGSVAYVTPSHQYPTGVTLTLDRRIELLAWAIETNSYIVEDDYDSDFKFNGSPLAALKGLDEGDRVFYVGTFSKCLGAGLRLGYIVVPKDLVPAARHYKTLMNNGQPWLEQAALADFMKSRRLQPPPSTHSSALHAQA